VGKLTGKLAHLSGIGLNGGLLRWEARERHGSFERCFFPSLHTVGIPTLSRRARKDRPPSVVMILTKSKSYAGGVIKPDTGGPLHTQEPVTVASFRTWRDWRECIARDRCLTAIILAFSFVPSGYGGK